MNMKDNNSQDNRSQDNSQEYEIRDNQEPQLDDPLGQGIKNAMASYETPEENLNKILMRQIREKEAYLKESSGARTISLWYLPMLLNGLLFGILAFLGYYLIPSVLLAKLVMSICIYMAIAGVALTAAGMWFSDLKKRWFWYLKKEGTRHDF